MDTTTTLQFPNTTMTSSWENDTDTSLPPGVHGRTVLGGIVQHVRLAFDLVSIGANLLLIPTLHRSEIRGTHSYRIQMHAAVADILLSVVSMVLYTFYQVALQPEFLLTIFVRVQIPFFVFSMYTDFLLVLNLAMAISLGHAYNMKVTRLRISLGLAVAAVIGLCDGAAALTVYNLVEHRILPPEAILVGVIIAFTVDLVVPAIGMIVLFRRVSSHMSGVTGEYTTAMKQRLEFVRAMKILLVVKVILTAVFFIADTLIRVLTGRSVFDIGSFSNVVYSTCRVAVYVTCMRPLRQSAEALWGRWCRGASALPGNRVRPVLVEPVAHGHPSSNC